MTQIQQQMDKLQMKAQEYDDAKRKAEEENKDGMALQQAIFQIAQSKGLTRLPPPPSGRQGK